MGFLLITMTALYMEGRDFGIEPDILPSYTVWLLMNYSIVHEIEIVNEDSSVSVAQGFVNFPIYSVHC